QDASPLFAFLFLSCLCPHSYLHSFPTRRSSDLVGAGWCDVAACCWSLLLGSVLAGTLTGVHGYARTYVSEREDVQSPTPAGVRADRKSTRLNSSHLVISYAVFCLKKKIR